MKKILGLDLGPNSIGWSVVTQTLEKDDLKIQLLGANSRVIPMDAGTLSKFESGVIESQTAERTGFRSVRKLIQRSQLRRERLHRVLNILQFLPQHYAQAIDFEKRLGQFHEGQEPLLPYVKDGSTDKHHFLFIDSFKAMLADFALNQPNLVNDSKKIPHNWTLYYLRKKALNSKITKEELAWIILNFNQKRGYYQQRNEEIEIDKLKEYTEIEVSKVVDTGETKAGRRVYEIRFVDGTVHTYDSKEPLDWEGKTKEFIITYKVDKEGNQTSSISIPKKEDDWTLIKKRTEKLIDDSGQTVGTYIYNNLLNESDNKIRGGLIQTIERDRYKEELIQILKKQAEFHSELKNKELYKQCIEELYRSNVAYRNSIENRDIIYLIIDDILFYHRPLKSQKHLIDYCQYEKRYYDVEKTAERKEVGVKCIHKAHPLFEEFRLWQMIHNFRIVDFIGNDVTSQYLATEEQKVYFFDKLKDKKDIKQKQFLAIFKLKEDQFKWNYGETTVKIFPVKQDILSSVKSVDKQIALTEGQIEALWHVLYSVTDKFELERALASYAIRNEIKQVDSFVKELKKVKPFESNYASYSEKAIKKLLPLMRMGKYWTEDDIQPKIKERLAKIIDGVEDNSINDRTREQLNDLSQLSDFRGLQLHRACCAVYGRYAEGIDSKKWTSPSDIDSFLENFKQHSLRNPIVEKVIRETLLTVRDVWKQYGDISEIHIELGREMKNPKNVKERISKQNLENERTNLRIRELLRELRSSGVSVRSESSVQQDRLKLYEEAVLGSVDKIPEDIAKIRSNNNPSKNDIVRYKCWLEQGCASPYTGRIIKLSELFTDKYQIEHVIPQARYLDDSLSNKIICESEVNKEKGARLAYEFILTNEKKIELASGERVNTLSAEEYTDFIRRNFKNSPIKRRKLMLEDIPESFIDRQMNDTRYISKMVRGILSNMVRESENDDGVISKNIITVTGGVTAKLKQDWGINDVWNNLIKDRFIRLNQLTNSSDFGEWVDNKFRISIPDQYSKGFNKKRIDHRHHAMDAVVIACATRSHINYLNNQSAKNPEGRLDLRTKLCGAQKTNGKWILLPPYKGFNQDVAKILKEMIVSIKSNARVITQSTNTYQKFVGGEKKWVKQEAKKNITVRRAIHEATIAGKVSIQDKKEIGLSKALEDNELISNQPLRKKMQELRAKSFTNKQILTHFKSLEYNFEGQNIARVEVLGQKEVYATRRALDTSFDKASIENITDTGIQTILKNHLTYFSDNPTLAFSQDGLDLLNSPDHMRNMNQGKAHKAITKVRYYKGSDLVFPIGDKGVKQYQYVKTAKDTNLFFAIYEDDESNRSYESIPLNEAIERLKEGTSPAPSINAKGHKLLYVLSPNDFVYLPTEEQLINGKVTLNDINDNKDRIYKFMSCTGNEGHFIPCNIAHRIVEKQASYEYSSVGPLELGSNNKSQRAWTGEMIKETCIPIYVDRLGNISLNKEGGKV